MSSLQFQAAEPADLEAMIKITMNTNAEHARVLPSQFASDSETGTVDWFKKHFAKRNKLDRTFTRIVVCKDMDVLIGHVLIVFWKGPYGPKRHDLVASIADISVIPERRSQLIGGQLYAAAEVAIREAGATTIEATVWRGSNASESLFKSAGFEMVSKRFDKRLTAPLDGPYLKNAKSGTLPFFVWLLIWFAVGLIVALALR